MAWRLYYISLLPLFGYIIFKYFYPCSFVWLCNGYWCCLKCEHYAFIVSVLCAAIALLMLAQLAYKTRMNYQISGAKISGKPESLNHEMIGVLSSVVLPFLTVNFTTMRECAASIFVIALIGVVSTRSNLYYKNPVLAIFNLKIYKLTTEHTNEAEPKQFDAISFSTLNTNDSLYLKKIGEGVYYAKKV